MAGRYTPYDEFDKRAKAYESRKRLNQSAEQMRQADESAFAQPKSRIGKWLASESPEVKHAMDFVDYWVGDQGMIPETQTSRQTYKNAAASGATTVTGRPGTARAQKFDPATGKPAGASPAAPTASKELHSASSDPVGDKYRAFMQEVKTRNASNGVYVAGKKWSPGERVPNQSEDAAEGVVRDELGMPKDDWYTQKLRGGLGLGRGRAEFQDQTAIAGPTKADYAQEFWSRLSDDEKVIAANKFGLSEDQIGAFQSGRYSQYVEESKRKANAPDLSIPGEQPPAQPMQSPLAQAVGEAGMTGKQGELKWRTLSQSRNSKDQAMLQKIQQRAYQIQQERSGEARSQAGRKFKMEQINAKNQGDVAVAATTGQYGVVGKQVEAEGTVGAAAINAQAAGAKQTKADEAKTIDVIAEGLAGALGLKSTDPKVKTIASAFYTANQHLKSPEDRATLNSVVTEQPQLAGFILPFINSSKNSDEDKSGLLKAALAGGEEFLKYAKKSGLKLRKPDGNLWSEKEIEDYLKQG